MPKIHSLPVFPSTCQIFRGGGPGIGKIVYDGKCEKRVSVGGRSWDTSSPEYESTAPQVAIYVPFGTDVRGFHEPGGPDIIMWSNSPAYLYQVQFVEDIAEGFPNRFRACFVTQIAFTAPRP
jgi:hypothetical protein